MFTRKKKIDAEQRRKAAYALNLCTVSVSQIIDYNDEYILDQEYDEILNNLNLQNYVKDDALKEILSEILDTCNFFKIQEEEKLLIQNEYQAKVNNAIWSAVPNLAVILTSGTPQEMAMVAAMQIGIGYMNYRKNKSQYALEKSRQDFAIHKNAMEKFHALRAKLFDTAWRLADTYDYDDALRLSAKQVSRYNEYLLDRDPLRRFEKLDAVSNLFNAFPAFWYHKGSAAREISMTKSYDKNVRDLFKAKALDAFRKFDEVHVEFMREDIIAASCALEHISLLDMQSERDKAQQLLEKTTRLAGYNNDIMQMCVFVHVLLDDFSTARDTLRVLINDEYNLETNGVILSRIYLKEKNQIEYNLLASRVGETNVMPWIEDDDEAFQKFQAIREDILKDVYQDEGIDFAQANITELPPDDTAAQFPKLRETVLTHVPKISTDKNYTSQEKYLLSFINKYVPKLTKETAIAFVDTSLIPAVSNGSVGLLFTTHALYYVAFWDSAQKPAKIPYSDIAYNTCKLNFDGSGKAISLEIATKDGTSFTIKDYLNHDALLDLFIEINKLQGHAPTDSHIPLSEMDYSVKLPYVKYLVNFLAHANKPTIEAMRFACDIGFTNEQLFALKDYTANPNESDMSLLAKIDTAAPYASRKSLRYAMVTDMYNQLYLSKGSFEISALEYEFLSSTAAKYGFNKEENANLQVVAQAKYKIITGKLKYAKELKTLEKALTMLALLGGVPIATIIGSSLIFWKTWWLFLIPGVGTILGAATFSGTLASAIIGKFKADAKLAEQRQEMILNEKQSYILTIDRLSKIFSDMDDEIEILNKNYSML